MSEESVRAVLIASSLVRSCGGGFASTERICVECFLSMAGRLRQARVAWNETRHVPTPGGATMVLISMPQQYLRGNDKKTVWLSTHRACYYYYYCVQLAIDGVDCPRGEQRTDLARSAVVPHCTVPRAAQEGCFRFCGCCTDVNHGTMHARALRDTERSSTLTRLIAQGASVLVAATFSRPFHAFFICQLFAQVYTHQLACPHPKPISRLPWKTPAPACACVSVFLFFSFLFPPDRGQGDPGGLQTEE